MWSNETGNISSRFWRAQQHGLSRWGTQERCRGVIAKALNDPCVEQLQPMPVCSTVGPTSQLNTGQDTLQKLGKIGASPVKWMLPQIKCLANQQWLGHVGQFCLHR